MLRKLIPVILIIALSFASFYSESTDYQYTIFSIDENDVVDPSLLTEEERIGQIASDFFAVKARNDDCVGWLNVPNVCYYPVMYSGDQYYLYRDVNKKYSGSGTLFMNKNSLGTFENTALIHGHHMRNGTMFASLAKYEFQDFFQNNPCVEVFDGTNLYYYKAFTSFYIRDGQEYVQQQLQGEDRLAYMQSLYERSNIPMEEGLTPDLTQNVLFLSTCEYYFNNCRLVVGFYLVKTVPYTE